MELSNALSSVLLSLDSALPCSKSPQYSIWRHWCRTGTVSSLVAFIELISVNGWRHWVSRIRNRRRWLVSWRLKKCGCKIPCVQLQKRNFEKLEEKNSVLIKNNKGVQLRPVTIFIPKYNFTYPNRSKKQEKMYVAPVSPMKCWLPYYFKSVQVIEKWEYYSSFSLKTSFVSLIINEVYAHLLLYVDFMKMASVF